MCEHRICAVPGCGEPIVRRPGEKPNKMRKRQTCSEPCRIKLQRHVKSGSFEKPAEPVRFCVMPDCGKPLVRRPTEGNVQWAARRCCSASCSTKLKHRDGTIPRRQSTPPAELRACIHCGGPIPWHPWMQKQNYEARRTCGGSECKTANGRAAGNRRLEPEMKAITADLCLSVTPRQVLAYMSAGDDERRLFAPAVRIAAQVLTGGAA